MTNNMGSSDAQVKEAVLVTPSDPTPSQVLNLSALDSQFFFRFTIEYLLIYRATKPTHRRNRYIHNPCQMALARTLLPYYPLDERVRLRADGSSLEVVCRGQGAVFIEATADCSVADFQRAPRSVGDWRKLLAFQVSDILKWAPPLVMQLTWLSDCAVALGVGCSHCICDGIGSCEFLNTSERLYEMNFREIFKREK